MGRKGRKGKMAEWQDDWIVFKTFLYVSNNKMMVNESLTNMCNSTDAFASKKHEKFRLQDTYPKII